MWCEGSQHGSLIGWMKWFWNGGWSGIPSIITISITFQLQIHEMKNTHKCLMRKKNHNSLLCSLLQLCASSALSHELKFRIPRHNYFLSSLPNFCILILLSYSVFQPHVFMCWRYLSHCSSAENKFWSLALFNLQQVISVNLLQITLSPPFRAEWLKSRQFKLVIYITKKRPITFPFCNSCIARTRVHTNLLLA